MSNTFLPFNFAPKALTILSTGGTTTYTIPANEFAMVTIMSNLASTASTLSVDGTVVYKGAYITHFSGQVLTGGGSANFVSGTTSGYGNVNVLAENGVASRCSEASATQSSQLAVNSTAWSYQATSAGTFYRGWAIDQQNNDSNNTFWAKAGNVLLIAGGDIRVIIHRYDLPT